MQHFNDFPCNNCGWCCQRTPCPVGLYLGEKPMQACSKLKETSPHKFECGVVLEEQDQIKKHVLIELIASGSGCSHKIGPSPVSLMRQLVSQGLGPSDERWEMAKSNTMKEYQSMMGDPHYDKDIVLALDEFLDYCYEIEN